MWKSVSGNDSANADDAWSELQGWLNHVPVGFLRYRGGKRTRALSGGRCWAIPRVWSLSVHNRNWQSLTLDPDHSPESLKLGGGQPRTLYLFSAHYDDRPTAGPIVRVTAIIDRLVRHSVNGPCGSAVSL